MTSQGAPLSIEGLRKVYTKDRKPVEVIRNLTLDVEPGTFVCIVGPSGAGKTTLLRCVAGLLAPTAGQVKVAGKLVTKPPRGMAVVFQEYGRSLFPWMTVQQNVEQPLKEKGMASAKRREKMAESLEAVGLADNASSFPWQLSGGMQQRVAIARAVAYEPSVLLMDEPFAAVDAQTRSDLEDLVLALWDRLKVTVLFVTHDIEESIYLGQRVLVLSDRPTEVLADIPVDLPTPRTQLETRAEPDFLHTRQVIHELIQGAKRGLRPGD